jgi:signal transduction histidine kinase
MEYGFCVLHARSRTEEDRLPTPLNLRLKAALAFLATLALGAFLIHVNERDNVSQSQRVAMEFAVAHGHLLQEQMNRSLSATYALAAVLRQGKGEIDNFDTLAAEMLRLYGGLSALQLAPNGVIDRIVPRAGNEAALGHDLLADPQRNKEAITAIETNRLTLAGPFVLRQGGLAVVGRLPVFLIDKADSENFWGERFWGFATAIIKIADLLAVSQLEDNAASDYQYELSRPHPDTGERDIFVRSLATPLRDPVAYAIEVPNGMWTLSVAPVGGWHSPWTTLVIEMVLVLLAALLVTLLVFNMLKQPYALRREVELRTHDLSAANRQLETEIVERQHAENELRASEVQLEKRVTERTTELTAANAALHEEQVHQRALIDKLEAAQNQLLQSEKMASIGVLAAGVAHEINNPIGFVASNLGSLERYVHDLLGLLEAYEEFELPDPQRDERLAQIRRQKEVIDLDYLKQDLVSLLAESHDGIGRVKKIVQSLKDFAHVDAEERWQADDIHAGIDSTLQVVWNELKYKCEIKKEYGELPRVECLISQLNQVFMNLLVNAAHAIKDRGVITIRTGTRETWVWIEISDTGKGIPPQHLQRIFDPFFTTKPVGKGTGLGLSVSYSIVEKHHGRIEVESEEGTGTTFRLWIPQKAASLDEVSVTAAEH